LWERLIRKASAITGFGVPTEEERKHPLPVADSARPAAGGPHRGVLDRSHYEDVLVVRVHNIVPQQDWGKRYDEINRFEKKHRRRGHDDHQSGDVRLARRAEGSLVQRLERPDKYWKYNPADVDERLLWPAYQEALSGLLERTSTDHAPWHVVPCDRKWYSRLAILELLIEALEGLNLSWPPADFDVKRGEEAARRILAVDCQPSSG